MPLAGAGRCQQRFQLLFEKLGLRGRMFLDGFLGRQRDGPRAMPFQAQTFFKK
jgi:hypothetical protein